MMAIGSAGGAIAIMNMSRMRGGGAAPSDEMLFWISVVGIVSALIGAAFFVKFLVRPVFRSDGVIDAALVGVLASLAAFCGIWAAAALVGGAIFVANNWSRFI